MGNRKMPAPDAALKKFFEDPKQFAALFNGVLFHGDPVIDPDLLEKTDTAYAATVEGNPYHKLIRYRDIVRTYRGITLAVFAVENENKVDHSMPIRGMLLDALEYLNRLKAYASLDHKNWTIEDILEGIPKGVKLPQVVTLVFYTGEKVWDGPCSIYDMIDGDTSFGRVASDYRVRVVDLGHDENLKFPDSSLEELRRIMQTIYLGTKTYKQQSFHNSMLSLAGILSGNQRLYQMNRRKETTKMCEALDRLERKGVERGIQQGIQIGEKRMQEKMQCEIDRISAESGRLQAETGRLQEENEVLRARIRMLERKAV